jgi:hypothetical protein
MVDWSLKPSDASAPGRMKREGTGFNRKKPAVHDPTAVSPRASHADFTPTLFFKRLNGQPTLTSWRWLLSISPFLLYAIIRRIISTAKRWTFCALPPVWDEQRSA